MLQIVSFSILIIGFCSSGNAQTKPLTNLPAKDSFEILNQLMQMLDSADKPESYVFANVGIGNRLYSVNNNALNTNQATTDKIVYSPALGYFHKTGFGLSAGANLLKDIASFGVNQYSVTPSFDLTGNKEIGFSLSYTHYFVKNKFSPYSSPVQNDFYTSLSYKKTWLQPGIALGYATGEYKEAKFKDTVIAGSKRYFYDSVNYKLNAFSLMLSASHQFLWYSILDKTDGLSFTPTLMANAGSGKTTITHKTNALTLFNFLNKRGRVPKIQNDKLNLQSIGLNLDLNYMIGNLTLEPQLYMNYYLPATDSKRFSQVFVFNLGYIF